jgi:hypothetical protein
MRKVRGEEECPQEIELVFLVTSSAPSGFGTLATLARRYYQNPGFQSQWQIASCSLSGSALN